MVKRLYKLLLALLVLSASQMPTSSLAGKVSEYKIKVVLIYNFAQFTKWPDDTGELKIGRYDKDPFDSHIDSFNGRKVEEVRSCHIAYFNMQSPGRHLFERGQNQIKATRVLTTADATGVINYEVIIGWVVEDDKSGFEVNHTVAKSEQLEVSAQLLRLVREVV